MWTACAAAARERNQLTLGERLDLVEGCGDINGSSGFSAMTDVKFLGRLSGKRIIRSAGDQF